MKSKELSNSEQIANITGLKLWKVRIVFSKNQLNLHLVTDDEIAIILHAAADLGHENNDRGNKIKEVTLEMIANKAGVSKTTVFRALMKRGGIGQISKETKEHVFKIANELGFKSSFKNKLEDFYHTKGEK